METEGTVGEVGVVLEREALKGVVEVSGGLKTRSTSPRTTEI